MNNKSTFLAYALAVMSVFCFVSGFVILSI
nr:MAG TPA: LEM3 (ligand-effect modulator 3) family / CDC50 family [Caudoviricetes sp.]